MDSLVLSTGQEIPWAPGIHFGYPEDRYHQVSALGSTSLKELVLDPVEYQHQRLHGGEKRETFALKWGSAIHCRALEGRESLKERFPIAPDLADYPKALVTVEHLRAYANENGLKVLGTKKKDDYIRAVREFDADVMIWDEFVAKFAADNAGKTILPKDAIAHIERAAQWMQRDRYLSPVMEDGTFTAGASEVSIFYEDNGVRLKARLDHLLSHAVVDLKSFRPFFAEPVRPAAMKAVARMRYDLQSAAYMRALKAAAKLYAEGKVFNCPYKPDFLESVFAALKIAESTPRHPDALKWIWVLIKASGAPQPIVAEFDLSSMIFKTAAMQIEDAIKHYRNNVDRFGLDQDWVPENPSQHWGDQDFPAYLFQ